jgi:hypothetical protein
VLLDALIGTEYALPKFNVCYKRVASISELLALPTLTPLEAYNLTIL